ncbi:MAG TPA: tripartite tricarboxylate transporter substrate binding protein [Burkholderiales bacterium]|nr:tripartite tricarboxylate transporter substrate binding protein [Burkholderiales bacterium]
MLFTRLITCAAAALVAFSAVGQSAFPERPVRLLVPVGAGGAADTLSRNLASGFAQHANGQALVVENRPGAGGTVAAAAVVREKPDGYTLFLAEVGPNAVSHALAKLPYDPHTAFTPIIHIANLPAVVLIRSTLPYKTLGEFIAAAKQQPGKFNYASAGLGNWTHLFHAYLNSRAGIEQVNVVYKSGAEMLTSLLRGDADTAIITVSTSLGQVREGKVRALAGSSMRPIRQLPDVPPAGQTIPGFDVAVWHGIVGPAGMDAALVARLNAIFNQVLQVPQVRTAITEAQAADIVGGTPQQFDAFIKAELKRWPEVVKAAGIKPE